MTPQGDPRIPYDQTDPMQAVAAPGQAGPGPTDAAMPASALPPGAPDMGALGTNTAPTGGGGLESLLAQLGGGGAGAPGLGGALGGPPQGLDPTAAGAGGDPSGLGGPASTDDLTGNDLAALTQPVGGLQSPEDQEAAQLSAALDDPNTPPDQKAQLAQMLDLAARRRFAGLGGGMPQGGGLGA
jgi:hypothetical protein